MTESAYIHIPFCKRKCNYCTFVSYPKIELCKDYVNALVKEIQTNYKKEPLKTIYFGGGTPSLLEPQYFEKILSELNFDNNAEKTVEINPESADKKFLKNLYNLGINRLSVGVQTFDYDLLKLIGRGHNSKQAVEIVKNAQNIGFNNISVDLIYGLPNQILERFEDSLEKVFALNIQHISLYGLKIEKGCYFYKNQPENLPTDDMQADYYLKAIELCEKNGFEHYEISNFALKNFESKHNLNYWNNKNYYGFGCSASGYENNIRYYNETNLEKYIENPLKKLRKDVLTSKQQMEEEIFLGFRKCEGINISAINNHYDIDFEKMFAEPLKKYLGTHILKTDNGYKLSNDGILLSNIVLSEFLC